MSQRNWKIAAAATLVLAPALLGLFVWHVLAGPRCTRTDHSVTRAQVAWMGEKVRAYRCDTGFWPESMEALTGNRSPLGPYANQAELFDAWGRLLHYQSSAEQQRFALYSLGRDGLPGGEGADADIVYSGSLAPLSRQKWYERGQPVESIDCSKYKLSEPQSLVLSHMKAEKAKAEAAKAAPAH